MNQRYVGAGDSGGSLDLRSRTDLVMMVYKGTRANGVERVRGRRASLRTETRLGGRRS